MPELPEVEVTRAGLADRLLGAEVRSARLGKPLRWPLGVAPDSLHGRRIGVLQRRGKYLWMPLGGIAPLMPAGQTTQGAGPPNDGQTGDQGGLLLHLGMSGSLKLTDPADLTALASEPGPHDHFDLLTSRGLLRLTDPRRFGAVVWSPALTQDPAARLLARLGAEPFDSRFTPALLHAALHRDRKSVV